MNRGLRVFQSAVDLKFSDNCSITFTSWGHEFGWVLVDFVESLSVWHLYCVCNSISGSCQTLINSSLDDVAFCVPNYSIIVHVPSIIHKQIRASFMWLDCITHRQIQKSSHVHCLMSFCSLGPGWCAALHHVLSLARSTGTAVEASLFVNTDKITVLFFPVFYHVVDTGYVSSASSAVQAISNIEGLLWLGLPHMGQLASRAYLVI